MPQRLNDWVKCDPPHGLVFAANAGHHVEIAVGQTVILKVNRAIDLSEGESCSISLDTRTDRCFSEGPISDECRKLLSTYYPELRAMLRPAN